MSDDVRMPEAWTRPVPEEIAPGTWRLALPMPDGGLPAVNCYLLAGSDRTLVIDAGCADHQALDQLAALATDHAIDLAGALVVATHVHSDHYPGAVLLRRRCAAEIGLGAGERPGIEAIADLPTALAPQVFRISRAGADELVEQIRAAGIDGAFERDVYEVPDRWLHDGEILDLGSRRIEVIATPGHTRGHVVFLDRDAGLLFTGDHVLPRITPSVGFEAVLAARPLADFLASLERVAALPDLRMMPAHGPAGGSTHDRVVELQQHHDRRFEVCRTLVDQPTTAARVAERMQWTSRGRAYDDLDVLGRVLAVMETAEHLDRLVDRGRLSRQEVDGVDWYSAEQGAAR